MALPQIQAITEDVNIPSSGQQIKLRQMLTKDEKIILNAKAQQGTDEEKAAALIKSLCQVVQNCIVTFGQDVEKLALFDIEYLFIKLREISVSNIAKTQYRDTEEWNDYEEALKTWDPKTPKLVEPEPYDFDIDLSKVKVVFPEQSKNKTITASNITIQLKYPDAALYYNPAFMFSQGIATLDSLVLNAVESIKQASQTWNMADVSAEELKEFLDNMPIKVYDQIREFLTNLPYVYYKIEYKNKKGNQKSIELTNLTSFFLL